MSRINSINGQSRARDITRLLTEYTDLQNRRLSKLTPSTDVPTAPAEPPKQAIHNLKQGARWFVAFQQSAARRNTQTNIGKTTTNVHVEGSGLATERQEDQDERKVIAPIPKNVSGGRPIKADKVKNRLIADTALSSDEQQSEMEHAAPSKGKRKGKRAKQKQAASRRKI